MFNMLQLTNKPLQDRIPLPHFQYMACCSSVNRSVLSIILRKFQQATASRRHDHSSSSDTSRYLLDPHSLSATYFRRAVAGVERALAVREGADDPRSAADLAVQPLDGIVGADASPVPRGEAHVGQRLRDAVADALGGRPPPSCPPAWRRHGRPSPCSPPETPGHGRP